MAESVALNEALVGAPVDEIKSGIVQLLELSRELEQASSAADVALDALNAGLPPT
jgi:hypothetical protein